MARSSSPPAYSYRSDANVPEFADDKTVIVFDGHCVMCSAMASFVIRRDHAKRFRLLAAQSPLGEALYTHYGLKPEDYSTNLVIEGGRVRIKMDGSLSIFEGLGWPWRIISALRILPQGVQNWMYERIARNRLAWFGRRGICYIPRPEDADRFL